MHQNYKNLLKAFSKKLFAPFKRHEWIYMEFIGNGLELLETTIAQPTFLKLAIDNRVID